MPNVTMGLRGKEDISWHDPASGTTPQTFTRPNSNPALADVAVTKPSAADLPLLDAPVISGAATPFEMLADTQAAKNVETALALVRKNMDMKKNFESYGGVPGTGVSDAVAQKNTDVFNQIVADLAAETRYNGILFPGTAYRFKDTGGTAILTLDAMPITLIGAGSQALLQAQPSSTAGFPLLKVIDGTGFRLVDLKLDRNGAGADSLRMEVSATPLQDVKLLNCNFTNGLRNVQIVGGGTTAEKDFWIAQCFFANSSTLNLSLVNISGTHILDNTFSGTGTGLQHLGSGVSNAMRDVLIQGNLFSGASQAIDVTRLDIYSATNHRGVRIILNTVLTGNIGVVGMNHVLAMANTLYAGRVSINFDMATAQRLQLLFNQVQGATLPGIEVVGTNTTLEGFEIIGGSVRDCNQEGIKIDFAGAPAKWGRIENVLVHNCSREDTGATDYTAILLNAPDAAGGVQETMVQNNVIRSTSVTAGNSNMHKYGVEEKAGGVSDKNFIGPNFIKGYTTADVLISGANSVDVVARYAVLDTAAAGRLGSYDQGAGV